MSKWALSALHFPEGLERTLRRFPWLAPAAGWGEALACRQAATGLLVGATCVSWPDVLVGRGGVLSVPALQAQQSTWGFRQHQGFAAPHPQRGKTPARSAATPCWCQGLGFASRPACTVLNVNATSNGTRLLPVQAHTCPSHTCPSHTCPCACSHAGLMWDTPALGLSLAVTP